MNRAEPVDRPSVAIQYRMLRRWATYAVRALFTDNLRVFLYLVVIVLTVLYSPEATLKFIYTEF